MEKVTPDEFFKRVGVRVPDGVIRNLEATKERHAEAEMELERCIEQLDLLEPVRIEDA